MRRMMKATAMVGAVCALAGATAGIATSSAATKAASTTTAAAKAAAAAPAFGGPGGPGGPDGGGRGHGGPGGPGGGGIHSETVVPDQDGSGFTTLTSDSGTLTAIDGSKLTLKQGTASETYATTDVTAEGTVTVRRNGATAKLSALKVGDHVRVMNDGTNTRIEATTAAWEKQQQAQRPAAPTWPSA